MTFEEIVALLAEIDPAGSDPTVNWGRVSFLYGQLVAQAEQITSTLAPTAFFTAQEWDRRIDCSIKLEDGSVATEMIALRKFTKERVRASGERLGRKANGEDVQLVDALPPPFLIPRGL